MSDSRPKQAAEGGVGGDGSSSSTFFIPVPSTYSRVGQEENGAIDERDGLLSRCNEGEETTEARDAFAPDANNGIEATRAWRRMSRNHKSAMRFAFTVLGAAVLLPFNALITPSELYRSVLQGSEYESSIMSWIVVVYNVACIVFGAHATSTMHQSSISRRIASSSFIILLVLLATTSLTIFVAVADVAARASYAFSAIVLISFALATATSYLQLAVVTLANAFGPISMTAMLSGQGMVGAIVSIVQLIATLGSTRTSKATVDSLESSEEGHAATIFYAAASIFMLVSLVVFYLLVRTDAYVEMQAEMGKTKTGLRAPNVTVTNEMSHGPMAPSASISGLRRYMSAGARQQYERIVSVQRRAGLACFTIAYIFIVTLCVFPALTSRVQPSNTKDVASRATLLRFVAWHFVAFNTSDLIGRTLPGMLGGKLCLTSMRVIAGCSILRTLFIPLLGLCNVGGRGGSATSGSIVFGAPLFFLLVIGLGLSNGYLATCTFITGPNHNPSLHTADERALAAGLLSWWLTIGLAIGSVGSFAV